jgi:hypothetical protein
MLKIEKTTVNVNAKSSLWKPKSHNGGQLSGDIA